LLVAPTSLEYLKLTVKSTPNKGLTPKGFSLKETTSMDCEKLIVDSSKNRSKVVFILRIIV
jgi:hypothetical protein